MKLDKELYTKHAKRLSAILNEKSTFVPYLTKEDFTRVLQNSLNTLSAVEKKLTNVELAAKYSVKTLVKQFNKLGKNDFKIDDKFKYEDEGDLIDNINYLHTYCKNIFKVNLDDLVEGKEIKVANPKIDLKGKPEFDESMAGRFAGADAQFGNPFVMGKAYAQLKQDIITGKLYTYKTKPRIMPMVKIMSVITLIIAALVLIIAAVFAFQAAPLSIKSLDGKETATLGWRATGAGVMYILIALFGTYPIYLCFKGLLSKNDNLKYHFTWPWILIFVIMEILFVITDFRFTWSINSWCVPQVDATPAAYQALRVWKIMYVVALSCSGLCLVPMIIGAVINPKQNDELIQQKLREYSNEITSSSGFGVPPSPTTDVQKPIDVKKTKSKSKDKK